MSRRLASTLLLLLGTAVLAATAYWLLFSTYMRYDDEGYVSQTLRDYSAHGSLYHAVYTQYGPALYVLYDLFHRLTAFTLTTTTARELTLGNWVLTAVFCAGITWRLTRSATAAFLGLGVTFYHLWSMVQEPGHPGSLLAVMIAFAAWAGLELIARGRLGWFAIMTGVAAALLALIKINVGFFFLASTVVWLLLNHRSPKWARLGMWGGILLGLLPPVLMHHFLDTEWARIYALLATVAGLTMFAAARALRQPSVVTGNLGWFVASGVGTTLLICTVVMTRGTGGMDLLDGILLGPMAHPGVYHFAPQWRPGTLSAAFFSAGLAFWCTRGGKLTWLPGGLATIRLALGALIFSAYAEIIPLSTLAVAIGFAVPLAWVFVYSLSPDESPQLATSSAWVGLLLAGQYLHAYPIAGSQISWGTFLLIPLATAGSWEAVRHLTHQDNLALRTIRLLTATTACAVVVFMTGTLARLGWTCYSDSTPLGLPGAEDLRPPESLASDLRIMSLNASAHGDILMSLPGLYSFNQWTGLPTPTLANATHWFSLLSDARQHDIMHALDDADAPVLIVERGLLDFLHKGGFNPGGPLYDYLMERFTKVFALDGYEFWARTGRHLHSLGTAQWLQPSDSKSGLPARRIDTFVAPLRPVVAVEIMRLDTPLRLVQRLSADNARLTAVPVRLDGNEIGAPRENAWGQPLPPIARLLIDITKPVANFDPKFTVIFLLDAEGKRVGEARFTD